MEGNKTWLIVLAIIIGILIIVLVTLLVFFNNNTSLNNSSSQAAVDEDFLNNETQQNRTQVPKINDTTLESVDVKWNEYTNNTLGFSIKVPKNVIDNNITIVEPEILESGNVVFLTSKSSFYYNEAVDRANSNKSDMEKVKGGIPWGIIIKTVNNNSELDGLIKARYGSGCSLGETKATAQQGTFDVSIKGDGLGMDQTKCPINYIVKIKYSPLVKKVAVWDIGQSNQFKVEGINDADMVMADSFKFNLTSSTFSTSTFEVIDFSDPLNLNDLRRYYSSKFNWPYNDVSISIVSRDEAHIRGNLTLLGRIGTQIDTIFLLAKDGGAWKMVKEAGQASYQCQSVEQYNFPLDMINDCFDLENPDMNKIKEDLVKELRESNNWSQKGWYIQWVDKEGNYLRARLTDSRKGNEHDFFAFFRESKWNIILGPFPISIGYDCQFVKDFPIKLKNECNNN